ncbi:hypothetical protein [Clostridium butyricum]|nr:hypothetical protein [Clostridium butyricum]NOW21735.1 hypothetical protein [Clostridium butyricum]
MNNGVYSNYLLYFISSFSGIACIYLFSTLINCKILSFLGVNSLIIMCVHEPLKRIIIKILSVITKTDLGLIRNGIISIFICTSIILLCILPLIYMFNKFLPVVVGKNNNLKRKKVHAV